MKDRNVCLRKQKFKKESISLIRSHYGIKTQRTTRGKIKKNLTFGEDQKKI